MFFLYLFCYLHFTDKHQLNAEQQWNGKLVLTAMPHPLTSQPSMSLMNTAEASGHRLGLFSPKDHVSSLICELHLLFSNV